MRADRLLSILLLLQHHGRMTVRQLAERLEVSERTICRDMEALSAAGVPVYAERGTGGGWFLSEGYRTTLTGLNRDEIQTVFLSNARLLQDLGLKEASDVALLKLSAALPAVFRRDAEYASQRIHIDGAGWHAAEEDVPHLRTLLEAVWEEKRLYLSYRREGDDAVERLVDPLGLVAKGNTWYLVAAVEGEIRTYRVSRVKSAELVEERAARPPGFDLAAYWEQSTAQFTANLPKYPALLRVHPSLLPRMKSGVRYVRFEPAGEPDADGWCSVSAQFQTFEGACEYVLGHGPLIEVTEPLQLREQVYLLAQQTAARYQQNYGTTGSPRHDTIRDG